MWTTDELARTRAALLAQLRDLERADARLEGGVGGEGEGDLSAGPIQQADLAFRQAEAEVTLGVLAVDGHLRAEIVDAIARLDRGRYGTCEGCGGRIPKARLRALPAARHCIRCASEGPRG